MWRTIRMAAFATAVTLVLSGFAPAQSRDGYYYGGSYNSQARQYGYQNGYRDGVNRGREEGRERDAAFVRFVPVMEQEAGHDASLVPRGSAHIGATP